MVGGELIPTQAAATQDLQRISISFGPMTIMIIVSINSLTYISLSIYDSLVHIYVNVNYATTCCYYHPFHSVVLRLCLAQCNDWCAATTVTLCSRRGFDTKTNFYPIFGSFLVGLWYIKVTFFFLYNFYKQTINLYRL